MISKIDTTSTVALDTGCIETSWKCPEFKMEINSSIGRGLVMQNM